MRIACEVRAVADRVPAGDAVHGRECIYDLRLQGAPYFRGAAHNLGVYGLAQPTLLGLKSVLSLLGCQPNSQSGRQCVWVCTREEPVIYVGDRPFVLREAHKPTHTFSLSDRAENLEAIEKRLRDDVLLESQRNGGMLLVHEEEEGNEQLVPTWVAVQRNEVRTVREVWKQVQSDGWQVVYHRLPIAQDQPLEHNYLDAYTQVIKESDPRQTFFVANCGAGVFRTTFAMIAAVIVRRRQMVLLTGRDPFVEADPVAAAAAAAADGDPAPGAKAPGGSLATRLLHARNSMHHDQALLRLVGVLSESLGGSDTQAALNLLMTQPALLNTLRRANGGDYGIIQQLCGVLEEGPETKAIVDEAIDSCMHLTNLRESILLERLRYSTRSADEEQADAHLKRAFKLLEVYYFLVAFADYVNASRTAVFRHRFVDWLKARPEISQAIQRIRTMRRHLYLFDPVTDLSALSGKGEMALARTDSTPARPGELSAQGAQVTGDSFAEFVVRNRSGVVLRPGLLLKCDIWPEFAERSAGLPVRGTVNFRRVPGTNIFATAQPTVEGIHNILGTVIERLPASPSGQHVVTWINLREEPLVYISGRPYCLRERGLSLRNIRDYSGIQSDRLAQLEERLLGDVVAELNAGDGKLLVHTEAEHGVVPLWEDAHRGDIATVQDVMDQVTNSLPADVRLSFYRVPITAERSADYSDISDLLHIVLNAYQENMAIVINCQLGRGRTTLVSVLTVLILRWVQRAGAPAPASDEPARLSYHVINSLLRVIPRGLEVKRIVDAAVDQCGSVTNIRDAIEDARQHAERAEGAERTRHIHSGVQALRRYFSLLLFQAYLDSVRPDTVLTQSFEQFVRRQPVLGTIARDLEKAEMATITPLRKIDAGDGMALSDEVQDVVQNRRGSILSAYTILKSDFFSGILKAGLPLRVEGMPNLRGVPPLVHIDAAASRNSALPTAQVTWGFGMPTLDGLRRGLPVMGAAPKEGATPVVWSNLREEPVLYVNGRPHVLRLADQPLNNMEATGVTTDVVERMERALKTDLLAEARERDGRVLLHDEIEVESGRFSIIPVWESVTEQDVLTPREVYELVQRAGFPVDYARVAITDEQAPVPNVFSTLEERVMLAIHTHAATAFNCQMGRGRTTTGMIIASLIITIYQEGAALLARGSLRHAAASDGDRDAQDAVDRAQAEDASSRDLREDEFFLRGEYRCILQLVGVLGHGKLAKSLVDLAIDRMETIQNLREAILMAKLRAEAAEPGSVKAHHQHLVFNNYLSRYGYLIAFASYLFDKMVWHTHADEEDTTASPGGRTRPRNRSVSSADGSDYSLSMSMPSLHDDSFPAFPAWLKKRREIGAILERPHLD